MSERIRGGGVVAIVVLTLAIGAVGVFPPGMTANQTGTAATPAASPAASPDASPVATPIVTTGGSSEIVADPASTRFPVTGNAFHLLEPGTPGELSVVAHGPIAGAIEIPVILRNNTDEAMVSVTVGVEARDASDNLIGSARRTLVTPPIIDPGALAIATIYVDQPIPDGGTVRFYPEGSSDPYFTRVYAAYSGIELTEFIAFPERLEGTVRITGEAPVDLGFMHIACFDGSGALGAALLAYPDRPALGPGESSTFKATTLFTTSAPPCDYFLMTGYGS
jgi:hypothetical protein